MNAAQRRLQRRQLARAWPVGTVVTHPNIEGQMRVTGQAGRWAPGHLSVVGLARGKHMTIHPRRLKRVAP